MLSSELLFPIDRSYLKALSADETSGMPGFLAAIDDLLIIAESLAALRTTLIITT